ncbi:MAG: hypothetical protein ACR2HG_00925 [Pyrinomonadaceae bacterium]
MENSDTETRGDFNKGSVLCLSCMKENDDGAIFCKYCNAPLSLTNNPDPLQRLATEGAIYSKAVEGKPKLIVLIGVWVIFFPVLVFSVPMAISIAVGGESGSSSFLMFWLMIISAFFSATMIYKVTKNYFKGDTKDKL